MPRQATVARSFVDDCIGRLLRGELDATTARADTERLEGEQAVAVLQVARGKALLTAIEALSQQQPWAN